MLQICLKYLYKILSVKYEIKKSNNISVQIDEILNILILLQFKKKYFFRWIKKNCGIIGDFQKISKSYSEEKLAPIIEIFERFPKMKEFIKINLISNQDEVGKIFKNLWHMKYE